MTGDPESEIFGNGMDFKKLVAEQTLSKVLFNDENVNVARAVIPNFRKILICAINGTCLGGSWEMAMQCDIIICSENTSFCLPELKLGINVGNGGSINLPQTVGKSKAMELLGTCNRISAAEAYDLGVVTRIYPKHELIAKAIEMGTKIAFNSTIALSYCKRSINNSLQMGESQAL